MSILTGLQFYLPMGVGVVCLLLLLTSLYGNCWRTVEYDSVKALELLDTSSRVLSLVVDDAQGYIALNVSMTVEKNGSYIKMTFPVMNYGGLWGSCDTIPDYIRPTLSGLKQTTQCLDYMSITADKAKPFEMDWELIRSSEVCAMVVTISFLIAASLGIFSVLRQQVVSAMITGVCCLAAALYMLFVIMLMHLKIANMVNHYKTSDTFPDEIQMRTVRHGWSIYLGWVAMVFVTLDGVLWILLSRKMSMVMMNYPPKYHQICSAYTA
ncbi:uncharacterized protein LOC135483975 [Lineus longissimus]|uniref:uncharacterized protein LOC135483975 n=1 Tax=Lineus longissimus TaxID=88925 RepID=UPI002B4E803B